VIKCLALAATLLATAAPALALSCLPPDPMRLYTDARDAAENFRVIHGRFTPQEPVRRLRPGRTTRGNAELTIRANLTGVQLGKGGFTSRISTPVNVRLVCFASWCGSFPEADSYLMAVEERGGTLTLTADPCSTKLFATPSREQLEAVTLCHSKGRCPASKTRPIR